MDLIFSVFVEYSLNISSNESFFLFILLILRNLLIGGASKISSLCLSFFKKGNLGGRISVTIFSFLAL